ncbi:MAG: DNA-binding response regulator, partial [Clostridiales bacterium]
SMRVKALLRRVKMTRDKSDDDIKYADLKYDVKKRLIYVDDEALSLTKTEFSCLKYMLEHFGEAISREELLENVWGYDAVVESRVTDETIRKIRKKMSQAASKAVINNKWGYGYILEERAQ